MSVSILRLPEVKARTGLSRSSIYRLISLGEFPASFPLGSRIVGWSSEEVDRWVSNWIAEHASQPHAPVKQSA